MSILVPWLYSLLHTCEHEKFHFLHDNVESWLHVGHNNVQKQSCLVASLLHLLSSVDRRIQLMNSGWCTLPVAYLYCLVVRIPVICAMKPGVGDFIWSTNTTYPGLVCVTDLSLLWSDLCHCCHFTALPYMHATHTGCQHLANLFGIILCLAIIWSLSWAYQ